MAPTIRVIAIRRWMNCSSSRPSPLDPAARKELFNQIQQIMYDDVVYIGMWQDPDLWSVSSRLKNVKFSGVYPFWNAYEWEIVE